MTLQVVPFEGRHLTGFEVQHWQRGDFSAQPEAVAPGNAWTIIDGDSAICAGGLVPLWPGRAYAWALLSVRAGRHMRALTRLALHGLDADQTPRIEMYVEEGFEAGHRWASMLGFQCETPSPMRNYLPGGRSAFLYARVK